MSKIDAAIINTCTQAHTHVVCKPEVGLIMLHRSCFSSIFQGIFLRLGGGDGTVTNV